MSQPPTTAYEVLGSLRLVSLSLERWRGAFARRWGLAANDSVVMSHLVAHGGTMLPKAIAHTMNVTTGSLTAMLDRLEAREFIRREPNPDDRRSVRVVLTGAGDGALRDTQTLLARRIEAAFDDDTRSRLAHCLANIAEQIDATTDSVQEAPTTRP